jgi:thioredoxin-related protein
LQSLKYHDIQAGLAYHYVAKRMPMKKLFIPLLAAVILLPNLYAALTPLLFTTEINWHGYKEARELNSDKPIFVFAKMRFCLTCAAMEKETFTAPALTKLLNEHFIPVQETINFALSSFVFDDLQDDKGKTLEFRGFPSVMIVKGQHYAISQGYKSAEELKEILEKVLP